MNRFIPMLLITLLSAYGHSFAASPQMEKYTPWLQKLDSVIAQSSSYEQNKENKIAHLKKNYANITHVEELYWLNNMLYNEYVVYDADSAMNYISKNLQIATRLKKEEWYLACKINQSFLLASTGLLKEASDALKEVPKNKLNRELKIEYYRQLVYLYSCFGRYKGFNKRQYQQYEKDYRDSVLAISTPADPYYYWYKGWKYMYTPQAEEVKKELEKVVSESHLQTRIDALNAYTLAFLYLRADKDEDNFIKYLIYSAIADVRSVNKDIASVEGLANILYKAGDIDRAMIYLNYCLKSAQSYPNRVRTLSILNAQEKLYTAIQQRNDRQESKLKHFLIAVCLLSATLIIALGYIYKQMKKIDSSRAKLDETNKALHQYLDELKETHLQLKHVNTLLNESNHKLERTNEELTEANYLKEEYIGHIFFICSSYINKLDEFRKNVARKLKVNQIEGIKKLLESPIIHSELKEFYHIFDTVFLRIYPHFVDDFNTLLLPEEQIVLKKGELLNTELRIYALVCMGFNDSTKIADFLHCSPQTVYNTRMKTRNKAVIPKNEFAETVMKLGKNYSKRPHSISNQTGKA